MKLLTVACWCVAALTALPLGVLSIELAAGLMPARSRRSQPDTACPLPTVVVLIPAHNEALGIKDTVEALFAAAPPGLRVVVVADNCNDETAFEASRAGAETLERDDPALRGKGYALAFGREYLGNGALPDVVVVVDADCRLEPGSLETLARRAMLDRVPVQAVNLIAPDLSASPMVQISGFAVIVKNLVRSRGMERLGGAALLTGTGMAFPWAIFAAAPLATGSIVEDLRLGLELTRAGSPPALAGDAHVRSAPAALRDSLQQRMRWEHGFLDMVRREALAVLVGGLWRASRAEVFLGLHLLVPPLALLMLLSVASLWLLVFLATLGAHPGPALLVAAVLSCASLLVVAAWRARGRAFLTAGALLRAPLYILWKLPIYLRFLGRPEKTWMRTPRR